MRTTTKIGIILVVLGYVVTSIGMLEYEVLKPMATALAYLGASMILIGGNMAPSVVRMIASRGQPADEPDRMFPK